jgi:16S rRNA processing protein RimM
MAERGQSSSAEGGASSQLVVVGRILGVHGVKGWVKVYSYTDPMVNLQQYQPWHLKQGALNSGGSSAAGTWKPVKVTGFRPQGKGLIAQLEGVSDREAAAALVGQDIGVPADLLPQSGQGEYYWRDLIGLRVKHVNGMDLGSVTRMVETGANDVVVVRGDRNSLDRRERLIPWLPEDVITAISLEDGEMTVDWNPDF